MWYVVGRLGGGGAEYAEGCSVVESRVVKRARADPRSKLVDASAVHADWPLTFRTFPHDQPDQQHVPHGFVSHVEHPFGDREVEPAWVEPAASIEFVELNHSHRCGLRGWPCAFCSLCLFTFLPAADLPCACNCTVDVPLLCASLQR